MDLIRSVIETVFYHLPLESVAEVICHTKGPDNVRINDLVSDIMSRIFKEFTSTDIHQFAQIMQDRWLCDPVINFKSLSHSTVQSKIFLERLPLLINVFSKEVMLCHTDAYPKIQFANLLRWRMLSLLTGEDLLTIPFIAREDKQRKFSRSDFCWPNILPHDNFRLNAILDTSLSDTHSHVNAAQDVFEFNWLIMMNYPKYFFEIKGFGEKSEFIRAYSERMEYDMVRRYSYLSLSLYEWLCIAAVIRLYLFQICINGNNKGTTRRPVSFTNPREIARAIGDKTFLQTLVSRMQDTAGSLSRSALKAEEAVMIDYAIQKDDFNSDDIPSSPFMIHHGERSIIYKWYRLYYDDFAKIRSTAPLLMLYLLIKNKIRREFIQTNSLSGFENFQKYQSKKLWGLDTLKLTSVESADIDVLRRSMLRYAVQSSIGNHPKNHLEARVVPGSINILTSTNLKKAIFGTNDFLKEEDMEYLTIVAHFIKKDIEDKDSTIRHEDLRLKLWHEAETLVDVFNLQKKNRNIPPLLSGIDAASSELFCRPEIFAPMFRFLRFKGLANFTFHAGEDFFDIVDGIRTVHETICFMGYTIGCRIGHGLALGINTHNFYSERHHVIMLPSQILLDNLVWMKYYAASVNISLSPHTIMMIEEQYSRLIELLDYSRLGDFSGNMWYYWQSMLMRGDYISSGTSKRAPYASDVMLSPVSPLRKGVLTGNTDFASLIYSHYERNKDCREQGKKPVMVKVPESFAADVANLQLALLNFIENKGIVIETNPSSNIKIGRFDRYDMHPITLFHNVGKDEGKHSMVVTINTDDKGVFATSLKNEYSLIALSLQKQRNENGERIWTDLQIEEYIKRIAHYGNITRFDIK